jgi:hypothetical protein
MRINVKKIDDMTFTMKAKGCPSLRLMLCIPVYYKDMSDKQKIQKLVPLYLEQCNKDYFACTPITISLNGEEYEQTELGMS